MKMGSILDIGSFRRASGQKFERQRQAAKCFRPCWVGASKLPGRFALRFVPDRCLKPKDGRLATGQTLVVASHHIRRRPRGISVLSDLFNPLGLGNSLPPQSPSSDSHCLLLLNAKSSDLRHGSAIPCNLPVEVVSRAHFWSIAGC